MLMPYLLRICHSGSLTALTDAAAYTNQSQARRIRPIKAYGSAHTRCGVLSLGLPLSSGQRSAIFREAWLP
jgi:hypothetical protein